MDLRLFLRVVSRFRYLIALGVLLACALTFISLFTVHLSGGTPKVSFRQSETYQSTEILWFTQQGCGAQCRALPPYSVNPRTGQLTYLPTVASLLTFSSLAQFYVQFANSDAIHALIRKRGPLPGSYIATTVIDRTSPALTILPFMQIQGLGSSPGRAIEVARRASDALRQYVTVSQAQGNVPTRQRAQVVVSTIAASASLYRGRRLTSPIVIFLVILIATFVLAFLLENLRPRVSVVPASAEEAPPHLEEAPARLEGVPASVDGKAAEPVHEKLSRARAAAQVEPKRK